ncbi:hypothetical protein HYW29_01040 [Candidatus Amesbacteria bacterium]|nr:hypothetical protein [Candidatus Amesbacteria bacterium]
MNPKDLTVQKRDGSLEPYQPEKLIRIALAASLTHHQALTLGTHIYDWALNQPQPIPTSAIRDQMVSQLRAIHPPAADLYLWYESTKYPPK